MNSENKKVNAVLILEIIGRPAEHLTETLKDIIKTIGEEKGVKVKKSKVNVPVLMKDQKDFYTNFAEIEVETDGILYVAILMFKYMPAHIEILSPQNISLTNAEWSDILSELTRRLHGYEDLARIIQTEKVILERKLKEALEKNGKEKDKNSKD